MRAMTIQEIMNLEVGDWVWIEILEPESVEESFPNKAYFQKADIGIGENFFPFILNDCEDGLDYQFYGSDWLAYKNKEQAEAKGEIVELIANVGDTIYVPWTFDGQDGIMRLKVLKIDITKSNINYCTDLGTDSEKFYLAFSRGEFNQNDYNKIWFIDKSEAEHRLAELTKE